MPGEGERRKAAAELYQRFLNSRTEADDPWEWVASRLEAAESALREINDAANLIGPSQPMKRAERLSKIREILARSQIEGSNDG